MIFWKYSENIISKTCFTCKKFTSPRPQAARELLSSYSVSPGQLDSLSNLLWGPPPPYEGAPTPAPASPPPASSSPPVNTTNAPIPARTSRSHLRENLFLLLLEQFTPGPVCWSPLPPHLKNLTTAPWTPGVTSMSGWEEGQAACQQGEDQPRTSCPPSR